MSLKESNFKIIVLTPSELEKFIYSDEFDKMDVIPISKHRALSQIKNPRVEKTDVIMLLAYIENTLVGYLGVLSDKIFIGDSPSKLGWLSCIWIDPKQRGKGIAKELMLEAFRCWNNKIAATEFTSSAKDLYDSSNQFMDLSIKQGIRCYMRFNLHELLPKKNIFFKSITPLLMLSDICFNLINDIRLKIISNKYLKNGRYKVVSENDSELENFIDTNLKDQLLRRNTEDLKWLINNPWIHPNSSKDGTENKYHFSAFDSNFEFRCIKIYDAGKKIKGFLIISIRGKSMKVPYFYYNSDCKKDASEIITKTMLEEKLNMLTLFNQELKSYFEKNSLPFLFKKEMKRHYIISKTFEKDLKTLGALKIQDGDADCGFT